MATVRVRVIQSMLIVRSPSLLCESTSENKVIVFVFVPILGSVFCCVIYWSVFHHNKSVTFLMADTLVGYKLAGSTSFTGTRAAFDFHIFHSFDLFS